nr:4Fe-4S binding protein [Desulfuromonas sp. KJ2020]
MAARPPVGRKDFPVGHHRITEDCIGCGACAEVCPMQAIHPINGKYQVDMHQCIDCGTCEGVCPVDAIRRR